MSAIGDSIKVELPTARFTAVNGKDETSGGAPMASMTASAPARRGSEEWSNGQPRVSPPGQEKLTITTTTQKDEWAQPTNGERPSERQPYPPSNTYVDEISHKRKRSDSHSASTEQQTYSSTSYHGHSLPSGKPTPTTASAESDVGREEHMQAPQPDSRGSYIPQAPYGQFNEGRESQGDTWYTSRDERSYGTQHAQPHLHPEDEQHLGEVIQRETQRLDAQNEYGRTISGEESKPAGPYSQAFMREESSPMSADPKKRKRNFSNRTKTGCMTCRRRKKKCDETKPECNNCLRGGFVCSGYQARGQWPKTEQKQPPIPLQSKNEFESPIQYSQRMQSPYNTQQQPTPPRRDLPGYRGQQLRVDPPHGRPIGMDDDQASVTMTSGSVTSPDNSRLSAISYQAQTPTPISASASAYPDRLPKNDFQRVGPLHDHTRHESKAGEIGTPQSNLPHILHPQSSPHANLQMVARTAQLAIQNPNANRPPTAKEHMLAGRQYFPFDKELVLERARCSRACSRFNRSTDPDNDVSPEERARLFRDILQPRENVMSPSMASPVTPVGRVGDNVVVEAPFHCDYGYNITIGKEVYIGKSCTILDTCDVKIGDRCIIGPNVNIYTAKLPVDAKRRMGSMGPRQGQPVTIENDCWIGGNVTILPGRTIGKNSTVGAGSVVTADVEPNHVVGGNPCRVIRRVGYVEEEEC